MLYMERKYNSMNLANNLLKNYKDMTNEICLIQGNEKITYRELYNKVFKFKEYLEKKRNKTRK